jgi:hypothetical protein
MAADYERQKLGQGVHSLAVGTGSIQERVINAYVAMHTIFSHGMKKPERQERLDQIYEKLTAHEPDGDEGSVRATVSRMTNDEASELAGEIADLYSGICHDAIYELEDKLKARAK